MSSPACHGPPRRDGVEWPAPRKIADVMTTVSVALIVELVLVDWVVQTNSPGFAEIVNEELTVFIGGRETFSRYTCSLSKKHTISPT